MNFFTSKTGQLRGLAGLLAVVSVLAAAVFMYARLNRERIDLPAPERQALYARAIETLRTFCRQPSGPGLVNYCRQQADFILRFPECDGECRDLAARYSPQPTR